MTDMDKSKELFEKITRLQGLLQRRHQHLHADRMPFVDPTRGQGRVLALLKMQPEISTKDLSYLLGIRQQSLSELLNKLEKAGYITKTPLETDKRVLVVKLTDKGRETEQETPPSSGIFDCLSEEEQTAFNDYLSRIIAKLEEELGLYQKEDWEQWMEQARSRMGDDAFEHLMSMRERGGPRKRNEQARRRRDSHDIRGHHAGRTDEPHR